MEHCPGEREYGVAGAGGSGTSGHQGGLGGVSCPAAGICVAVGGAYVSPGGAEFPLAELWSHGHWAIEPTPDPAGDQPALLTAVSCVSASDCTAVGAYISGSANVTLAEHWDGTNWSVVASPNPSSSTDTELDAVSCASAASCTATGLYVAGHQERPLAEHWDGTTWTIYSAPLPAGSAGDLSGGVSCPSDTACIAVGSTGSAPLAERWNGKRWNLLTTPAPAGASYPRFNGVSCSSAGNCTAVGEYLNGNVVTAMVERWNGTSWTIQADAAPAGTGLADVSCTTATSCTAVGTYVTYGAKNIAEAEHWDGTSWTPQTMPVPYHKLSVDGVSCHAAHCTAVGGYAAPGGLLAERE